MTAPLTRRDAFALAAMQAMISVDAMSRTHIAQYCVALTDLVLAELDRTAQPEPAAEQGEWIRLRPGECFNAMARNYSLLYENGILVAYRAAKP